MLNNSYFWPIAPFDTPSPYGRGGKYDFRRYLSKRITSSSRSTKLSITFISSSKFKNSYIMYLGSYWRPLLPLFEGEKLIFEYGCICKDLRTHQDLQNDGSHLYLAQSWKFHIMGPLDPFYPFWGVKIDFSTKVYLQKKFTHQDQQNDRSHL